VAQGRRGFDAFTRGTVLCADPSLPAIFGFACTATIRALAPSSDPADDIRARRMAYYRYMAEGPQPRIAVLEDLDGREAVGAYWGEVNTTVHKGLGVAGALTNGVMRDLGELATGFQVIAGSVGPSHGFVYVVDINQPVTVFGLRINPGDFIHADRHGAVVVPPEILPQLPDAVARMQASEKLILEPARQPDFDYEKFEAAWSAFEKARV
jgi:regulator of RNase E activity RraA